MDGRLTVAALLEALRDLPPEMPVYVHAPSPEHQYSVSPAIVGIGNQRAGALIPDPARMVSTQCLVIARPYLRRSRLIAVRAPQEKDARATKP